jgi:hypothetical protein
MPLPVTDPDSLATHSAPGLRWASQESGDLIGSCGQRLLRSGRNDGFIALQGYRQGLAGLPKTAARPAVYPSRTGAQVASLRCPILRLEQGQDSTEAAGRQHNSE